MYGYGYTQELAGKTKKKETMHQKTTYAQRPAQQQAMMPRAQAPIVKQVKSEASDDLRNMIEKRKIEKDNKRQSLFSSFGGKETRESEKKPQEKIFGTTKEISRETIQQKPTTWYSLDELKKDKTSNEVFDMLGNSRNFRHTQKPSVFDELKEIKSGQKQLKKEVIKKIESVKKPKIVVKTVIAKKIQKVVSTKEGNVYHKPNCITIKGKKGMIKYESEDEAKKSKLKKCSVCFPEKKK